MNVFWAEFSASALFSWFRVVHDSWNWIAGILWKLGGVDGDPVLRGMRIRATWGM